MFSFYRICHDWNYCMCCATILPINLSYTIVSQYDSATTEKPNCLKVMWLWLINSQQSSICPSTPQNLNMYDCRSVITWNGINHMKTGRLMCPDTVWAMGHNLLSLCHSYYDWIQISNKWKQTHQTAITNKCQPTLLHKDKIGRGIPQNTIPYFF